MQTVANEFTVEAKSTARMPVQSVQVAWKKGYDPSIRIFTIATSVIGGDDIIGGEAGVNSAWKRYQYFDESDNVLGLEYERGLNYPLGGIGQGLFDIDFDNTSDRYTPYYMGGAGEMFTAQLPRRPVIINTGFNYNGIDNMIPQFVGLNTQSPDVDRANRTMHMTGSDFLDFLNNKYVDDTTMFSFQRSDVVIENALVQLGYTTADYALDEGIQVIDYGIFEKGKKFYDLINDIAQAENAHFYLDEEGRIRFENRYHWSNSPHNAVQTIITTAEVINYNNTGKDNMVNVVEIIANPRTKYQEEYIFALQTPIELNTGDNEIFVDYENPVLEVVGQSLTANDDFSGLGKDRTSNVSVKYRYDFAETSKYVIHNSGSKTWLTDLSITGRPAKVKEEIYVRLQDDSSVTAYEPQKLSIENDFIQTKYWAESYAQQILNDLAEPENLIEMTIKALPHLQLGDLLSWQGKYWRIYHIDMMLDTDQGFIQRLKLVKRDITRYFVIGVSTIGGSDMIAP